MKITALQSETDRRDWDAQCAAIFGSPAKGATGENTPTLREAFYRCTLVAVAGTVA